MSRNMSKSSSMHGVPRALDGQKMDSVSPSIEKLNKLGGKHGVGRIDHVREPPWWASSRACQDEAFPACVILHDAHLRAGISRCFRGAATTVQGNRSAGRIVQEDLIYNGLWFSSPFIKICWHSSSARSGSVNGGMRVKLSSRAKKRSLGRKSEDSLYSKKLATYDKGDQFDREAAMGFIRGFGTRPANAGGPAVAQRR